MKDLLRIVGGVLLVLLGISGIILPILPGWIFLIPGLVILADYFPPVRRLVNWAQAQAARHVPGLRKQEETGKQ